MWFTRRCFFAATFVYHILYLHVLCFFGLWPVFTDVNIWLWELCRSSGDDCVLRIFFVSSMFYVINLCGIKFKYIRAIFQCQQRAIFIFFCCWFVACIHRREYLTSKKYYRSRWWLSVMNFFIHAHFFNILFSKWITYTY